ncbi:MAG: hypothetical protein QOD56_2954 [Gammaproteobacteria bacterium]|jgi:hypothetical protein|nr:hypothetical protein [Gammaproteobacteria bacterium]
MFRACEKSPTDVLCTTHRNGPRRPRAGTRLRACAVVAALIAGSLFVGSASAQVSAPTGATPHVVTAPAKPPSKNAKQSKKPLVSPYARAAAQRARAGQPPVGHAPTRVQAMGKAHKPHAAAPAQ